MKKKISNIFDEAKASEIETLVSQNEACDLSPETLSAVKEKVYAKMGMGKMKMKKSFNLKWKIFVAIVACLSVVIGVCVGVWKIDFSSRPGNEKTPVEENKPKEDIFLYTLSQSSPGKVIGSMSAKDYGICDSARSEDQVFDELKNKEKTPFGKSRIFVYQRSECEFTTSSSQKVYGNFYSTYDRYVEEESGDRVNYLHGTNILTTYFKGHVERPRTDTPVDEITAKQIAEDFILKIITEEEFSKFDEGVFSPYAGSGLYAVCYTRYIGGYATDEDITVVIHPETKEITLYSAQYFGKYDALEAKLTKEKLDAANEKLRTKIEEMNLKNLSMGISRIVTTIFGEAFIRIPTQYDTESGGTASNYTYLNIQ